MENELKAALGHILGEIYSLKNEIHGEEVYNKNIIDGLILGCEPVIDNYLTMELSLTNDKHKLITEAFNEIFEDEQSRENFTSAYLIEEKLRDKGVERWEIIASCRIFKAYHKFESMIQILSQDGNSATEYSSLKDN